MIYIFFINTIGIVLKKLINMKKHESLSLHNMVQNFKVSFVFLLLVIFISINNNSYLSYKYYYI